MDKDTTSVTPEIVLKLTSKGTYIWQIRLPIGEGVQDEFSVVRLKKIDNLLKENFPRYAQLGSGRSVSFNEFDE